MKRTRPPGPKRGRTTYSAPALEKGFNVLELLARDKQGLTLSEIAAGIGLSLPEIFRIIVVMERRGWLRKSADDKYSVTPHVLHLAFKATSAEELSALAIPQMRELCAASDQSCHLVIRNGDKGLVITRQQNPGPTGLHVRVGTEIDLKSSASGHVLLAFTNRPSGAAKGPPATAEKSFAATLSAVRQRGYERMESARTLGVTDISYPIFDMHGDILAALTVPFLRFIDGSQIMSLDDTQALLDRTAKRISAELGVKREAVDLQG
ncbi:MAG TPA: IclR family transcriptional regulator [Steroidobacteraceae bacterium]